MKIKVMFQIIGYYVVMSSCHSKADKYIRSTKNMDGPPCKDFVYYDFESLEVALCKDCGIHLGAPNNKYPEFADYFYDEAITIYRKSDENLNILNNPKYLRKVFAKANSKGKISEIGVDDTSINIKVWSEDIEIKEFEFLYRDSSKLGK